MYKMIASTSLSEVREITTREITIFPGLEEITGADLIITPLSLPVTECLLSAHIQAGAMLVQIKRGHDLPSSIMDGRLLRSLARMRTFDAHPWQSVLLFIGAMYMQNEICFINGQEVHMTGDAYWTIKSALSKWNKRGGVVEEISKTAMLPDWVDLQERIITEMQKEPSIGIYPARKILVEDRDDPLQDLVLVEDIRRTLASLPGMGAKRIQVLFEWMDRRVEEVTLWEALYILTNEELASTIPGIGKGVVRNIRAWFGLETGFDLCAQSHQYNQKE